MNKKLEVGCIIIFEFSHIAMTGIVVSFDDNKILVKLTKDAFPYTKDGLMFITRTHSYFTFACDPTGYSISIAPTTTETKGGWFVKLCIWFNTKLRWLFNR